jgi:RNA polymerase sigma factor (sigma-70 family)
LPANDEGGSTVEKEEFNPQLSQLTTEWSLVVQSHLGSPEQIAAAQVELMDRYAGAVHRYLLSATHDPDAAAELAQEFALRFVRGDFHRADPTRGRFRDFVKRALRNLIIDDQRRRVIRPRPMGDDLPEPTDPAEDSSEFERRFVATWRSELMARAWAALARLQEQSGQPYHTVLRLRVDHPEMHSPEMAEALSKRLGRPIAAGGLRMALQRSRQRFVEFLLEDVTASLGAPTQHQLEEELIDLGLFEYCGPVLKRRGVPKSADPVGELRVGHQPPEA